MFGEDPRTYSISSTEFVGDADGNLKKKGLLVLDCVRGIQVDDERELPGHERTQIPDEELWEVNLEAKDGSHYEVDSKMLKPVSPARCW